MQLIISARGSKIDLEHHLAMAMLHFKHGTHYRVFFILHPPDITTGQEAQTFLVLFRCSIE